MESHDEMGCQAPNSPILCINNCGFFGSAATMNMCSKCHKDVILKQEQTKFAVSSIGDLVNRSSSIGAEDPVSVAAVNMQAPPMDEKVIYAETSACSSIGKAPEVKAKRGPNRCNTCRKRVGLTGFNCRCGNLFCSVHRYSDKHECPFDYRTAARDAIAKANPLIKANKLDRI